MLNTKKTNTLVGSGSYLPEDVTFLLRSVEIKSTDIEEKERLIQTGQKHYSEMISIEKAPSSTHVALYEQAITENGDRMAQDILSIAVCLNTEIKSSSIVLVSLVRAGLPPGVLLKRAIEDLGREVHHYGISIVRDRGIDFTALEMIISKHGHEGIVFVDGWTGKGAISKELNRSLGDDVRFVNGPKLVVLADPCGHAWLAASSDDWVIPSGILGATVSGLISRSIWPSDGGVHGCVECHHISEHDVTNSFISIIDEKRKKLFSSKAIMPWTMSESSNLQERSLRVVDMLANRFSVINLNRIKPGIAEATRAVLRRVPYKVIVRDLQDPDVELLVHLSLKAGVEVEAAGDAIYPYRAVTIIRESK